MIHSATIVHTSSSKVQGVQPAMHIPNINIELGLELQTESYNLDAKVKRRQTSSKCPNWKNTSYNLDEADAECV